MESITANNRINELFEKRSSDVLNVYFTAGYPEINDTLTIAEMLDRSGADIIEIGMPFSDPIADGPTIQESNTIALENGMTLEVLFDQLANLRAVVNIPVILMGYVNPVIQFGIERFCARCQEVGIDGLILPDLPMQEYLDQYKSIFDSYGLKNIFLITPQTSEDRIRLIDENTDGFIYMVSSASTTGAKSQIGDEQLRYFERIGEMTLSNPTLIGFGISNRATFERACSYANGAIIGSAFIKLLSSNGTDETAIKNFVKEIKNLK